MKNRIFIAGGGGYIGTVVSKHFLNKGYKIDCLDNFIYKNSFSIDELKKNNDFKLIYGDLRNEKLLKTSIINCDALIILAGLVGDPITKKYPSLSTDINLNATKKLIDISIQNNLKKIIFVSTCSNYGLSETDELLNENAPLKPLSLYAKHKVEIEKYILSLKNTKNFHPTILRFSTAFGLSPRMRFDLTINQFTKSIFLKEKFEVFDSNTWRPYCHVKDFALALEKVLETDQKKTSFEVFNVGGDKNNFTKKQITETILKIIPNNDNVSFTNKKFDPRNYRVDFSKINQKLNFEIKYSVEEGIEEIIQHLKSFKKKITGLDQNLYGNYIIKL